MRLPSTIKRAVTLTGVAVGHEGVVVVGAEGAVGVAFAVARIVCKAGRICLQSPVREFGRCAVSALLRVAKRGTTKVRQSLGEAT